MPAFVVLLQAHEKEKGAPLTQAEVEDLRDRAVGIMLPESDRDELWRNRGYADIDMDNPWVEWQSFIAERGAGEP